jgi:hypothetical protein
MRPRRLPRLPRKNDQQISNQNDNDPNKNQSINNEQALPQQDDSNIRNIDSDFIRKKNKIRERHREDFAITIAPNREDLVSEDAKLYDNKDINLEAPKIRENIDLENTEFYIESIHHDQYYKINQIKKEEQKKEEILGEPKKTGSKKRKKTKKLTAYEQAQALENKLFNKFDKELTDVITKTLSKVTLIFLFAQGLLAGMGLLHILINLTYDSFKEFLNQLAHMIIIMFDIFHALTFTSLVGNGIKFVSSYQKYKIISLQINNNLSEFMRLRQNMIFSAVLWVCFTIVFFIEVYLATFIQKINLIKCSREDRINMTEDDFMYFKYVHLVLDFFVIILFILNIFDLNIQDESNDAAKRPINLNFYLGSEENQGTVEVTQN